ncbi:MAG: hypothetical protein Q9225_003326 [Loekoesia sp. 1 TL-2023]
MGESINYDIVNQLATGFGALLEQVQELDKRNTHLEQLLDRIQEQVRVNQSTALPVQPTSSIPSIYHKDTTGTSLESGLHVDYEDNQLHLGKVSENIKWHITGGFKAWSTLRCDGIGQYPRLDRASVRLQQGSAGDPQLSSPRRRKADVTPCPFVSQQVPREAVCDTREVSSSKNGSIFGDHARPKDNIEDPIAVEARPAEISSHHPSQAGSTSKCPIRFLDQHSPEEVAAYFKNHRHEIPRSHEICVKRYQRNEDQIRQLDHKYGNLVNMIQGLGQKHQPMLHTRTDEENISQGQTSQGKVDAWAKEVNDDHKAHVSHAAGDDISSLRDGHFDRPLKDIRVGESPSRPWGISVPQAANIPPSAASGAEDPDPNDLPPPALPTPSSHPPEQVRTGSPFNSPTPTGGHPKMVFTGPVFIGYSPEQITDMLERTGIGKANGE